MKFNTSYFNRKVFVYKVLHLSYVELKIIRKIENIVRPKTEIAFDLTNSGLV